MLAFIRDAEWVLVAGVSFMSRLPLTLSTIQWDFSDSVPRNHAEIGLGREGMEKVFFL